MTSVPTLLAIDFVFSFIVSDGRLEFRRNKKNNADGIIQHHFSAKGGEKIHSIDLFTATRLFFFFRPIGDEFCISFDSLAF